VQSVLASLNSAASSADNSWTASLESFFTEGADILDKASGHLFLYLLAWLLVLGGLYFTVRTGFVQLRLFPYMVRAITSSRDSNEGGISSFQAFAVGLASRVGTGNIVGVAIAITMGGPGAVFWMWIVALLGMATAYAESALAQLYKVNDHHGLYRGGPAFYISRGLKSPWAGAVFSVALLVVFGLVFNAVQANAISESFSESFGLDRTQVGVGVAVLSGIVIFGGIRNIARVAEVVVPFMAVAYLGVALWVLVANVDKIPDVLVLIVRSAFGMDQAVGGVVGGQVHPAGPATDDWRVDHPNDRDRACAFFESLRVRHRLHLGHASGAGLL